MKLSENEAAPLLLHANHVSQAEINALPKGLRTLVKTAVTILGEVVRFEAGEKVFDQIEAIRRTMAKLRGSSLNRACATLRSTLQQIRNFSPRERDFVSHSFTLMLELINSCENAYRSYRLMQYPTRTFPRLPKAMIYVVTAHPTEARSPSNIAIFHEIQKTLTQVLINQNQRNKLILKNQLELAWHISTAKTRRPRVKDEAEHIYSIVLRDETLNALLETRADFGPIYIRSWVGGDKDGHPGVNKETLLMSLNASRKRLHHFFKIQLKSYYEDLLLLQNLDPKLNEAYKKTEMALSRLKNVKPRDGDLICEFHQKFKKLFKLYHQIFSTTHPTLSKLRLLLQMFPALVVPMELREHSDLIQDSVNGKLTAISQMLSQLKLISQGGDPQFYVRGLIISMASSFQHIQAAAQLVRMQLGEVTIPVIPLFEQHEALVKSPEIMKQMLENPRFKNIIHKKWHGFLEVMLGYSDSAKELGVFASHLNILNATQKLDRLYQKRSIIPVFFHGSGGSTDRGGGPIEEQTDWWPDSALQIYKATIQGEMVERTFASSQITRRRFEQIVLQMNRPPQKIRPYSSRVDKVVQDFASQVSQEYQKKVASPDFLNVVQVATAYRYLSVLKIGSRPSKRGKNAMSITDLRTIPWVLCWTQTRVLFPTWWGVGTVWTNLKSLKRSKNSLRTLQMAYDQHPAFRSYVKILSSTLARVELSIWRIYLESSPLPRDQIDSIFSEFQREYQSSVDFVKSLTRKTNLLWFRPWFGASIHLRSPMIHPLNLLQLVAIQEGDHSLLRETVTGIASGMMTTG